MSTRSAIGYMTPTGSVRTVYCHFDGYIIDGVGEMLATEYQAAYRVAQLVEMGDISSLGRTPFTTTFYGRDRKETEIETQEYSSVQAFVDNYGDDFEYIYMYGRDGWLVKTEGRDWTRLDSTIEAKANMEFANA